VLDYHNGAMDGFMWEEWPDGYNYYGRGIPVPTPDPSLVHPRRPAGHDGQARPASRAGQELASPNGFTDDEDELDPYIQKKNHVPPIQTDEYGFGMRVPALVISPYSNAGTVVHTQHNLTSLLKLVETKFGLSSLTSRDGASNTMLDRFNFAQPRLPPVIITS
jgi:Phosphoesterase family